MINNRTYIFIKKNGIIRDPESGSGEIRIEKNYNTRDRAGSGLKKIITLGIGIENKI